MNRILSRRLGEERPAFFDIDTTFPELRRIDESYDAIRAELLPVLPRLDELPRYHEVDEGQAEISAEGDRDWRVLFVHMHGAEASLPNRDLFPRTTAAIARVPDTLQAFFSILEPGKSVPAHNGPYFGYLRYHTAFVVPLGEPPRLRVNRDLYTWKEGESVLFDDSWEHEVINESDSVRVVLILDFMRPLPPHLALLNWAVRGLAGLSVSREGHEEIGKALGYQGNPAA